VLSVFLVLLFAGYSHLTTNALVSLKFGDEVYSAEQVSLFLDEIYSSKETQQIFNWHKAYGEVPYSLFISESLDTPKLRADVLEVVEFYNSLMPVNLVQVESPARYRAMYAFVDSYDEIKETEMARYMYMEGQISEEEYQRMWLGVKQGTFFIKRKFGFIDDLNKTKLGLVNEFMIDRAWFKPEITREDAATMFCKSAFYYEALPTIIENTCLKKRVREGQLIYPLDEALLTAIRDIPQISNMKKALAKQEIMKFLLMNYKWK